MTGLSELAARVEAAEGSDRELDARIWCALHSCAPGPIDASGFSFTNDEGVGPCWQQRIDYTASLDAAMTLVPEGCLAMVSHLWDGNHRAGHAVVNSYALNGEEPDGKMWTDAFTAVAHTPALALCSAALRAHAAQGARP